ncbi:zinc finger protein 839 [Perognathus longimembris pacificus]|uniref:zinc finger protein 839 n=1 Tax=Perognathus longimembris pacificus TaxID=214514 RepID=UPI0020190003|nr:zinc finger protein 839 [Perognathus longimembris pacificus]
MSHKQLEAIRVEVTTGDTRGQERPMPPPLATTQPPAAPSSILVRLCTLSRAQPRGGRRPRPPAGQGLAQRPLPALQPLPTGGAQVPRAPSPSAASSSAAARAPASGSPAEQTGKPRRPSRVKTRSGRISRPPTFKARDYRFIRTEGLLDGHPSDSDDYSELSVEEEEEEQREPRALLPVESGALRPRAFKCPACAKSYIGQGGLARHFKLNPGHGPPEPAPSPGSGAPAAAQGGLQNGRSVAAEENGSQSALLGPEDQGPRRSGGSETLTEGGTVTFPGGRAAPPHRRPAGAAGLRAQLEESLQQCAREELVELVLPRLARVVTVYEFLLTKVEKSHLAKPFFPAIYKEFEELHHLVKKMCRDYLSSAGPRSPEPLEIRDRTVAESLGITEEFLRQKEISPDCTARKDHVSRAMDVDKPEGAGRPKRDCEAAGEGLATGKRPRRHAGPWDSRGLEEPRPLCGPSASEGFPPTVSGQGPLLVAGSWGMVVSDGDGGALPVGQKLVAESSSADLEVRSGTPGPALLRQHVNAPAHYTQPGEPWALPSAPVAVIPEEKAADRGAEDGQMHLGENGAPAAGGGGEPPHLAEGGPYPHHPQARPSLEDDCVSSTGPEPEPQLGPDWLWSAQGSTGGQRSRGRAAVGDTPAFTVTSGCQEEWGGVLIQTSDGDVLSCPGSSVSQEDVVLVTHTGAGGAVLKVGLPEGAHLGTLGTFSP